MQKNHGLLPFENIVPTKKSKLIKVPQADVLSGNLVLPFPGSVETSLI
jgi:hypothetical protein